MEWKKSEVVESDFCIDFSINSTDFSVNSADFLMNVNFQKSDRPILTNFDDFFKNRPYF
jgi:hypothetical protein